MQIYIIMTNNYRANVYYWQNGCKKLTPKQNRRLTHKYNKHNDNYSVD